MLFEMVTGRKAFQGDNHAALMVAILEREPPPLSSLQPRATPALERIVRTCLAKDPDDRWQTARDLMRELQWLAESDAEAVDAPATVRRPRRRWTVPALMIVTLGAVAAGGYLVGTRATPAPAAAIRVDRLTDFPGLEEYPPYLPMGGP